MPETFVANVDEVTVKRRLGQFIAPTKGMDSQVNSVIERFACLHGLASRERFLTNAVQVFAARYALQKRAKAECLIGYHFKSGRYVDARQGAAAAKRAFSQFRKGRGKGDFGKSRAAIEGVVFNGNNAFGNSD